MSSSTRGKAKKFVQRANHAFNLEVISQYLSMADWCLSQAIKERDGEAKDEPSKAKSN
ncbi:hypothetical protein [Methyloceanibacter sp.]|uniref:hypothetical protein n=1 Tax=Methyloceanibacter sp. TaxID=1965321 RepID=UPI002CB63C05|nr:hypothetical protein [Methyloceanibacter sp.]